MLLESMCFLDQEVLTALLSKATAATAMVVTRLQSRSIAPRFCRHLSTFLQRSVKQDPVQAELVKATRDNEEIRGLGAPEVHQLGQNLIHLIKGRRILDIGTTFFRKDCLGTLTGASAFAWALAIPADGQVISMDRSHTHLNNIGRPILEKKPEILKKIDFRLAPATETLGMGLQRIWGVCLQTN